MRGLLLLLMTCVGCNNECADPSRVSGDYTVFGTVREYFPEDIGALRTEGLFYSGEREWELRFVRASGTMSLTIEGQELVGSYEETDGDCNRLGIHAPAAAWVADVTELGDPGSIRASHVVDFNAELVWTGDAFSGEYSALDNWSMNTGESGSIEAEGYLIAERLETEAAAE